MSTGSFGIVPVLFLVIGWSGNVGAQPAAPLETDLLPPQVQRIDGLLVPVPSEIFRTLDRFRDLNWKLVLHPELATLKPDGSRAKIALALGVVVAEGFVAVAAEEASEVEELGISALSLARALGVEKSVLSRGNSIMDHARKMEWTEVRKEWASMSLDIKAAMREIGSEPLSQLVTLGGWIRGTEALSALISIRYSAKNAEILHQPVLLDYFDEHLSQMPGPIKRDRVVIETAKSLAALQLLIGSPIKAPLSSQQVSQIHDIASERVKSLTGR